MAIGTYFIGGYSIKKLLVVILLMAIGSCEEFLHTFHMKISTHKKPTWEWNYYVVVV
jgi:hypothetical protein